MEERRLLLAVALSLLVLTAYQFLFPAKPPVVRPVASPVPGVPAAVASGAPSRPELGSGGPSPTVGERRQL